MALCSEKWLDVTRIHDNKKSEITNAVIGMHCFSGCDTVEKFSRKTKIAWMQAFMNTKNDVLEAFKKLKMGLSEEIVLKLAEFMAKVYMKKSEIVKTLSGARWLMYLGHYSKSEKEQKQQKKYIRSTYSKSFFSIISTYSSK